MNVFRVVLVNDSLCLLVQFLVGSCQRPNFILYLIDHSVLKASQFLLQGTDIKADVELELHHLAGDLALLGKEIGIGAAQVRTALDLVLQLVADPG